MSLKCAHCGAELTVHRNLALHPTEEGCAGVERPKGVAAPPPDDPPRYLYNAGLEAANLAVARLQSLGHKRQKAASLALQWSDQSWIRLFAENPHIVFSEKAVTDAKALLKIMAGATTSQAGKSPY